MASRTGEALVFKLVALFGGPHLTKTVLGELSGLSEKRLEQVLKQLCTRHPIIPQGQGLGLVKDAPCFCEDELCADSTLVSNLPPPLISLVTNKHPLPHMASLEDLLQLCRHYGRLDNYRSLLPVCTALLRHILAFRPAPYSIPTWKRFVELCRQAHIFSLPYFALGHLSMLMLYKARGLAFAMGDVHSLAGLDVMLGSETTRLFHTPMRQRLWQAGQRGKKALATVTDWELQTRLSLYLGMLEFDQGCYQSAIGHFSLCNQFAAEGEQTILGETSQLYQGHAASLLGNFAQGTEILRSCVRQASAQGRYNSLAQFKIQLCSCLLAQGYLEEPLEMIDSIMSCISPSEEPMLWMCTCSMLAYYHRMSGHLDKAYTVFWQSLKHAGQLQLSYFIYHMPFFLELLYVWDEAGFPPIDGCIFQIELHTRLEGYNDYLRAVALRLWGQTLLRDNSVHAQPKGILALEQSLALTREAGAARERAKSCVILASAYMKSGRRQAGLALAMEAWSLSHMLRQKPWIELLATLVPAPLGPGQKGNGLHTNELYDRLCAALMDINQKSRPEFYHSLLLALLRLFGMERACLLRNQENIGRYAILAQSGISEKEINSRLFLNRVSFVEQALAGTPVFTAVSEAGKDSLTIVCIPVMGRDLEHYVLYMDGDIFPELAHLLTHETLLTISRTLAWEFVRFERSQKASVESSRQGEGPADFELVYRSPQMDAFLGQVELAARSEAAVLLYGETGTGKELIARRIHEHSGREGPFVPVNLTSMPEDLFESEMFGYERGAFTGAMQRRIGLAELAHKGTLFIDEMPDISQRVQIKLLRLLQEKSFTRLGSNTSVYSDFRLVVATNRNIRKDVEEGRFREDLYYRISVLPLTLPPLRERVGDILPIFDYYVQVFNGRYHKNVKRELDAHRIDALETYSWPGNVRELKNLVERMVIHERMDILDSHISIVPHSSALPDKRGALPPTATFVPPNPLASPPLFMVPAPIPQAAANTQDMLLHCCSQLPTLREVEEGYVEAVLRFTGGKVDGKSGAAAILGLKRSSVYNRIAKLKNNIVR